MSVRTTKRQLQLFERECRKWVKRFALKEWFIEIRHEDLGSGKTVAQCQFNAADGVAALVFNLVQTDNPKDSIIRRFALHECLELLMCRCSELMWRDASKVTVDTETHRVIRTLENLLLESRP